MKKVNEFLQEALKLLNTKSAEYSEVNNRLSAFDMEWLKDAPAPEVTLWGMLAKHLNSIYTMIIKQFVKETNVFYRNVWKEKCFDAINYLLMLLALIEEHNN